MSRIVWDRPQDRKFEVGVEKGVLYVNHGTGVPWNGLTSVNKSTVEAEPIGRYQDGVKTHNHIPYPEYESEVTALTYPDEFESCLGVVETQDGFYVEGQGRTYFGLTYQTRVGDSVVGDRRGYKIHLIYNAIATPNQTTYQTITDAYEPVPFSWGIQTSAIDVPGYRPTSHFILDPSRMGPKLYEHLHDRLYGAPGVNPRLLTPSEILEIAGEWHVLYPSPNIYPSLTTSPGGP